MDFPEFVLGAPEHRPQLVVACAARTQEIRYAESQRELHAVVGVQIDARVPLGASQVARDVRQQLHIPDCALEVQALGSATFILGFGHRVRDTVGSVRYHARVCLEGVLSHAWNVDSVTQLFCPPSFINDVDYEVFKEVESSCFNLWVWMADPNALPKKAILKIEEPYARTGPTGLPILRHEAARTLDYEVLIHLERVLDYAPFQGSPSHASYESAISGIPDDDLEEEWLMRHFFSWIPGVPDGERLPIHGGRVPVCDRLGGHRDRSPPADGGAEGSRRGGRPFRQFPQATWRDVLGGGGNGQRRSLAGGYRRRRHAPVQLQWRERRARAPQHGAAAATTPALFNADGKEALLPFPAAAIDRGFYGGTVAERQAADPMQDEVLLCTQQLLKSTYSPLEDAGREADQNGTPYCKDVDLTPGEQPQTQRNGLDNPGVNTKDIHAIVGQPIGNAQLVPPPEQIVAQGPSKRQQNTPVDQAHQDADLQSLQSGVAQKRQKNSAFTKQLQPPVLLLSNAYPKVKTATADRTLKPNNLNNRTPSSRKSARIASKGKNDMTMEEQATALLMKKCGDSDKIQFIQEIRQIKQGITNKWLLLEDFNMILTVEDNSNGNLNRRLMGEFRKLVNDLELKELRLRGRKFTWSNNTTHTRIDRAFCTIEQLSDQEVILKRDLKAKILGMTAIEKLRVKQQSRIAHIKAAEAQAKLFHIHLNGRRRKKLHTSLGS
uniref:DUF4283 domain-containing protein n=1 Tax=Setaria viridis TaxID=4556 RepID=A0A4U6WDC1_SETVI|nr:hypothetical protein SEVIR_1G210300v2 [Setaria viridis]